MTANQAKPFGDFLGLIVHDLRNPTAAIRANLVYLEQAIRSGNTEELAEAFQDALQALDELGNGLDQVSYVGRWLSGKPAIVTTDGDLLSALEVATHHFRDLDIAIEVQGVPRRVRGGGRALTTLVQLLLSNAKQHAARAKVTLVATYSDTEAILEMRDHGSRISPDFISAALTLEGQVQIKGNPMGRYGRVAGLLSARAIAESIGARLEIERGDYGTVFRTALLIVTTEQDAGSVPHNDTA